MVLAPTKMYRPTDVAADIAGNTVYVVDQFNHRVSKWDYTPPNFTFTIDTTWGDKSPTDGTTGTGGPIGDGGSGDLNLYRPTGIAFDSTNSRLYVTDTFHNRVRVINSSTGAFVSSFGTSGFGAANFYRPAGIAINGSTGTTLVIADELNSRAVKYDVNGGAPNNPVVLTDPSVTTGLSFVRPHGVVFDVTAIEFNIGDSLRSRISSYNVPGVFQIQYGAPGTTDNNINLFYPGSGEGLLTAGALTAFTDTRNNAIKTMNNEVIGLTTADGTTPNAGTAGTGDGQLYYPESVSAFIDTSDYVLVANTLNNRIETFSSNVSVLKAETPFNFGKP